MTDTLADLERLTRAAIDALERTRRGELDQMALLDARSVELVSVHGKRVLAMLRVIEAAKAMRDAGVSIGQRVVLPDAEPDSMADDTALGEFIGIFDGPLQRDFDAALAALDKEQK